MDTFLEEQQANPLSVHSGKMTALHIVENGHFCSWDSHTLTFTIELRPFLFSHLTVVMDVWRYHSKSKENA